MATTTESISDPDVLLISMPWTTVTEPSLGLGILKAVLAREEITSRVLHLSLFLLQHLRPHTYEAIARVYALNDFLFSGVLDPGVTHAQERWLRQKARILLNEGILDSGRWRGVEGATANLLHLRQEVLPRWVDGWADELARSEARLVGFTCMFDQTIASVALAKRLKDRAADKLVVLGGYAVRSPTAAMLLRSCPWIDAVCDGEGETTVIELARAAKREISLSDVRGIVFRSDRGEPVANPLPPVVNLDTNPTPCFDDFYADIRRLSAEHKVDVSPIDLPVENSRGCWWGAKSHCVFCGIRDEDLAYRVRHSAEVLKNLDELRQRYGIDYFRFTDYILPHQYHQDLVPELIRRGKPYRLSAEIKANITEEQVRSLAQAGFVEVQPGIESFSSDALRKMDKGVSALQNVYTLVLGQRFGVHIHYNILYGFPNDDPPEYEGMATILPRLFHLDPPVTCGRVQITRWAPLQTRPEDFGIEPAQAEASYELVFSHAYRQRTGFSVDDYCYYFERTFENPVRLQRTYERIDELVRQWREFHLAKKAWLYEEPAVDGAGITIHDRRGAEEKVYDLGAATADVLHACLRPVSLRQLDSEPFWTLPRDRLDEVVNRLDSLGLIFRERSRLVSLVLCEQPKVTEPGGRL